VCVSRSVLDGAVVSFLRVGFELEMSYRFLVLAGKPEVDQENVVLFVLAIAQQQVLSLDVVVNVSLNH
jgi:hypothetical protein